MRRAASGLKGVLADNATGKEFENIFVIGSFILFLYLFLAELGLCCWAWAFSSCGEVGASHCGGFSCCGAQALGLRASVVEAHGL